MIVPDSTFLIDLIRSRNNTRQKEARNFPDDLLKSGETYNTGFVNVYELYYGAYRTQDVRNSIEKINEILADISVIDHSDEYYSIYGDISAKPGKKGTPIGKFDQLVAAIVIYHDAKLVTNNTKDFERVLSPSEIINH